MVLAPSHLGEGGRGRGGYQQGAGDQFLMIETEGHVQIKRNYLIVK
jgi:hypothetical protein